MKTLKELKDCKIIHSASSVDLKNHLDFVSDKKRLPVLYKMIEQVETYRFIYKVGKLKVVGYITLPKVGKNLPCLVHLRGGSGNFAMLQPRSIIGQMVKYALEGYIVISTQYPGVEVGDGKDTWGGPDDLNSITKLRDILKVLSVADDSRIGMKGHSRGGLMAYMMLHKVKWIKAAVIAAAPVDQMRQAKERPNWREHQISLWGTSREELKRRSPLRWVDKLPKKVPILIMHGSADWRVNPLHGIDMSKALYENLIPHRFILFEGADHGITEYKAEYFKQTLDWFDRFLKDKEPLPNVKPHGK